MYKIPESWTRKAQEVALTQDGTAQAQAHASGTCQNWDLALMEAARSSRVGPASPCPPTRCVTLKEPLHLSGLHFLSRKMKERLSPTRSP